MAPSRGTEDFFDAAFLSELEEIAGAVPPVTSGRGVAAARLAEFVAPEPGGKEPLGEEDFLALPPARLAARADRLIEICREGRGGRAARAAESFVIFFQTLLPTLGEAGARQIERVFYRLVPTLVHVAYAPAGEEERAEMVTALGNLEAILIEISSIRLAPAESELVFRSIDHLAAFIAAADYALANEVISDHLLGLIRRNRIARALYRLMEVEVTLQRYLNERLGYPTPQIRLPEDEARLADYGPIRVFFEESLDGERSRLLQLQIPDVVLRDVVLHLVPLAGGPPIDLRLDAVGAAPLEVPDGLYALGLEYQPS